MKASSGRSISSSSFLLYFLSPVPVFLSVWMYNMYVFSVQVCYSVSPLFLPQKNLFCVHIVVVVVLCCCCYRENDLIIIKIVCISTLLLFMHVPPKSSKSYHHHHNSSILQCCLLFPSTCVSAPRSDGEFYIIVPCACCSYLLTYDTGSVSAGAAVAVKNKRNNLVGGGGGAR